MIWFKETQLDFGIWFNENVIILFVTVNMFNEIYSFAIHMWLNFFNGFYQTQ